MSAWSVLPNAHHIDRILESLNKHHDIWYAVYRVDQSVSLHNARYDALNVIQSLTLNAAQHFANVRYRAWQEARDAAWDAAWAAGRGAAWKETRAAARDAAWAAARNAIAALIAWDDSAQFLNMDGDALEIYARLSDDTRAILLLPAVRAFERIKELETV